MRRFMRGCVCGRALSCGPIRRSIKATDLRKRMARPDSPARNPTRSASPTRMPACSAISSGRRSTSAALTVGKFAIVDIFDTNKYANNPKIDFLNWSAINTGSFDYAGDAWGYTYGAAAEWYQGRFTFRGGVFDMSAPML